MIHIVLILSITLTFCVRIMMPKLKMVWNGQVILVSKLVADHRQSLANSKMMSDKTSVLHGVTGFNPHDQTDSPHPMSGSGQNSSTNSIQQFTSMYSSTNSAQHFGSLTRQETTETSERNDDSFVGRIGDFSNKAQKQRRQLSDTIPVEEELSHNSGHETPSQDLDFMKENTNGHVSKEGKSKVSFQTDKELDKDDADDGTSNGNPDKRKQKSKRKIVIREGEVPSKKLTVKMLDLQSELDHVIQQIMSGMAVDKSNWEAVRDTTAELDEVWSLVKFDWQADDHV
jgi:hypothetical protein